MFERKPFNKHFEGRQATPREELENPARREVLRKLIEAATVGVVGSGSLWVGEMLRGNNKKRTNLAEKKKSTSIQTEESKTEQEHKSQVREHVRNIELRDELAPYTFLNSEFNPQSIDMGDLAGKKFSALYASYLGIPDGSTVPETLQIDFKANLAALWREKFGFDAPNRTPEQERVFREGFLARHHDLMDLAEQLFSSYAPHEADTMSLDSYIGEISGVIKDSLRVFLDAMYKLRDNSSFQEPRRLLIEKMANRINAKTLLSCSLTELMPSADGETNTLVFDFLLRNAGVRFIDRIPSVHDMLPSFGPYQITPALFGPDGAGTLAEQMETQLPRGFMPESVQEVSGTKHHRVAYIVAMEHIVQFAGGLNTQETTHAQEVFNHTDLKLLHKEMTVFVAAAHHLPSAAYTALAHFVQRSRIASADERPLARLVEHMEKCGLHQYTDKALANYTFLTERGVVKSLDEEVS